MTVTLRVASNIDADAVAQLTIQLGYDVSSSDVRDRLSRILARNDQQFLVAELDGRVVGWLHAAIVEFVETGAFVIIGGLVVDRDRRGRGIGRLLMRRAEEWAAAQRCPVVRLWSSAGRTDAHRFYERLGYTNVKTQYSFVRVLEGASRDLLSAFVPRVNP